MLKKLKPVDNFHIWHDYNTMSDYVRELRGFIDAGILESCPRYFKEVFSDAERAGGMFYRGLQNKMEFFDEIKFNIDFVRGIYDVDVDEGATSFDEREFLFANLNLKPEYRSKVEAVLDGE